MAINNFALWAARRMRLRRGAPSSTATGVVIAVAGVALALSIMELTLCIAGGFKSEIERKVLGFGAPLTVLAPYDVATAQTDAVFVPSDTLRDLVASVIPSGSRTSDAIRLQAIVKTDSDFTAVEMVAHSPGHDFTFERSNMVRGTFPDFADTASAKSVVISAALARTLNIDTAARPFLYFFADGDVKARRATVSGIYSSSFSDYDKAVVYASPRLLQGLSHRPIITGIDIENVPDADIDILADTLQQHLVRAYQSGALPTLHPVTDIHRTGALYFNWLDLLDTNVVVIFILMLCVAGFTLVSSLFIIVLDRVPFIGVLRAIGARKHTVTAIFMHLALRLVGAGVIIGNLLGLGLCLLQRGSRLIPLDPEMYYLSYVPVLIHWPAIVALNIGTIAVAAAILLIPARFAASVDPGATMRY